MNWLNTAILKISALAACCFVSTALPQIQTLEANTPGSLHSVWQQTGGGRFLVVSQDEADFYHHTQSITYRVTPTAGKPLSDSYANFQLSEDGGTLKLWRTDFGDRCERQYFDTFTRVDALPGNSVKHPEQDPRFQDPQFVFQLVCEQFDEHFPFFENRRFDWATRKQQVGAQLQADSTDEQLYTAITRLLDGLNDSHTRLYWDQRDAPYQSGEANIIAYLDQAFEQQDQFESKGAFRGHWARNSKQAVLPMLADGQIKRAANGRIRWGVLKNNIGYIENDQLSQFSKAGTPRSRELAELEAAMDQASKTAMRS